MTQISVKNFVEFIKKAEEYSLKRNFKQSFELIINIVGLDLKRTENRINTVITLPHSMNKVKICVFGEREIADKAKKSGADLILRRSDIEKLSGNKREIKKIASKFTFFLSQPDLMPLVGKIFGAALGSRGKFPEVILPTIDIEKLIQDRKRSVRIRLKTQPVASCRVGVEGMEYEKIAENAITVVKELEKIITGKGRIKNIYFKKTAGKAIKVK